MEKGLVLHKGHSPSSYARDRSASRAIGPSPHKHPASLIWGARDNVGLLNPAQLLGRKRDAYPSPTRGQHKWGDAYPCPARVPITWYAYCFEMLAYWCLLPSFSIHSPLGHLAHKYKQNTCIRHVTVQCIVR